MRSESTRFLGQPKLTNARLPLGEVLMCGGGLVQGDCSRMTRTHPDRSREPSALECTLLFYFTVIAEAGRNRQVERPRPSPRRATVPDSTGSRPVFFCGVGLLN